MKITEQWLKEKGACSEGMQWFFTQKETESKKVLDALIKSDHLQWANWLLTRLFEKPNNVRYAIFAAEQIIEIFEKKYPKDKRPRKAIEAAKAWLKDPNEKTRAAAYAAYDAAYAAYAAKKKLQLKILAYGIKLLKHPGHRLAEVSGELAKSESIRNLALCSKMAEVQTNWTAIQKRVNELESERDKLKAENAELHKELEEHPLFGEEFGKLCVENQKLKAERNNFEAALNLDNKRLYDERDALANEVKRLRNALEKLASKNHECGGNDDLCFCYRIAEEALAESGERKAGK